MIRRKCSLTSGPVVAHVPQSTYMIIPVASGNVGQKYAAGILHNFLLTFCLDFFNVCKIEREGEGGRKGKFVPLLR